MTNPSGTTRVMNIVGTSNSNLDIQWSFALAGNQKVFPYIYFESDSAQPFTASLCQNSHCESCSVGIGDACFTCEPGFAVATGSCDPCNAFEFDSGSGCEACDSNCQSTCKYTKYDCDSCVTGFVPIDSKCSACPPTEYANCKLQFRYIISNMSFSEHSNMRIVCNSLSCLYWRE